jgi:hypothetical protein
VGSGGGQGKVELSEAQGTATVQENEGKRGCRELLKSGGDERVFISGRGSDWLVPTPLADGGGR